jgi:hypothetical protein
VVLRKEFLGRGWRFPFGFNLATGGVAFSEFEQNIQESITVILGTRPGERQMLPEFGCRIHELMFAPANQTTASLISHRVEEALARWEPRIKVERVEAWPDPGGRVRVEVHYTVRSTQEQQQIALQLAGG